MPKLTFGLPCFDDPRAIIAIQSLAMHSGFEDCEIVAVDSSPDSPAGKALKQFIEGKNNPAIRYVPLKENLGPAITKNAVFEHATGDIVACLDCHVLFECGVSRRIINWFDSNPEFMGLLTGPLMWGDGNVATHFDPVWRGHMWGTWGTDPRGIDPKSPPFEVWGQGCGFFACRKSAWLGFHPEVRGFGAEEGCIHEKFRQAGHRTLCHPGLRWWHDFSKAGRGSFPLRLWDKVRNYVLEFQSMGLDASPIHEHFVSLDTRGKSLPEHLIDEHSTDAKEIDGKTDDQLGAIHRRYKLLQSEWEHLLADPVNHREQPARGETIEDLYNMQAADKGSDLNEHMPKIRELAGQHEVVVEVNRRSEWTTAILAGKPKKLTSYIYTGEAKMPLARLLAAADGVDFAFQHSAAYQRPEIEECDLLVHKVPDQHHDVAADLTAWAPKVRQRIVLHDANNNVQKLPDGTLGYGMQMRNFLLDHKGWEVEFVDNKQWGLIVLKRLDTPRAGKLVDPWPPGKGPGTNLADMLHSLGLNARPSCSCNRMMLDMDVWGVEGCREHREQILKGIKENYANWNWKDKITLAAAAGRAVMNGLAFSLNPLKPIESMVDEAIRQADATEHMEQAT